MVAVQLVLIEGLLDGCLNTEGPQGVTEIAFFQATGDQGDGHVHDSTGCLLLLQAGL